MELPAPIREMACSVIVEQMSPVWLRADLEGRLVGWGGDLATFGIAGLESGQPIGRQIDFLDGVLPLTGGRLVLRHIAVRPGISVDLHMSPDDEGDWVLLLDTTAARRERTAALQPLREAALSGGRPVQDGDRIMAAVPAALDFLVLEREREGVFRLLAAAPAWGGSLLGAAIGGSGNWRPADRFPFLGHFLADAEAFWAGGGRGVLRSGLWSEPDPSGAERYFEARAVSLEGRPILLIECPGSAYRELIQTGREIELELSEQERAATTLARANADLERRVAHRTAELAQASARLQALSRRLMGAQEAERRHIARELHDEIGQSLTAVVLGLRMCQDRVGGGPIASRLQESIGIVERVLQQARDLSLDLRPSLLDDLGLAAALRWHVDRQARLGGLVASVTPDEIEPRPRPDVEIACFRVAQEALTNIIRHARATHVAIELRATREAIELVVRDDGVGFHVLGARRRAAGGHSLGLLGMEERVLLVGGRVEIESDPGVGTVVRARFPRDPERSGVP